VPKILRNLFFIGIGLSILIGFFVSPEHPHFWWEKISVFDVVFGFVGCILLMLIARALGRWVQRDEDYYD